MMRFVLNLIVMKNSNFNWEKIYPADIDYMQGVNYFAFSKNDQILHVEQAEGKDLFSQLLVSAIKNCLSIYDVDVWVGVKGSTKKRGHQTVLLRIPELYKSRSAGYEELIVA